MLDYQTDDNTKAVTTLLCQCYLVTNLIIPSCLLQELVPNVFQKMTCWQLVLWQSIEVAFQ